MGIQKKHYICTVTYKEQENEGTEVPSFYSQMISKKKVIGLINERMEELDNGLFIVEVDISSANVIKVELDKHEGNVSVEDCIRVSRNVEHNLDREEQDFELSVSSAGLDKGLRVYPQYKKNIGRDVKVKLNEGGKLEGKMIDATEEQIVVQTTRKERIEGKKKKETIIEDHVLTMDQIKDTKIVISFK
ncbi:MAG: ribosome assembly cofactor RimP [Crocinitomicaceae bacterium]|nr:ribosome assembly cofactor RimP [Crocinitomicaceae bacterium]